MFRSGLVVLTSPVSSLMQHASKLVDIVAGQVEKTLYVHLLPGFQSFAHNVNVLPDESLKSLVLKLYASTTSNFNDLDVRILLGNISNNQSGHPRQIYSLREGCNVVWTERGIPNEKYLMDYLKEAFPSLECAEMKTLESDISIAVTSNPESSDTVLETFNHVCLGGTFDRIHTGHKLLLSQALLLSEKSLTIGVTDGDMNKKKTLCELIQPCESRLRHVRDFVEDVKPDIEYKIVPIHDPFGPSIVDARIECLVVSEETIRGGEAVNARRNEKGLDNTVIKVIDIVEDPHRQGSEESKISSSSMRRRQLGSLIHPVQPNNNIPKAPYIIGVTGGIASGKSSVCKRLENLGAHIINCDKLGHVAYLQGTDTYHELIDAFGRDIIGSNNEIDRKVLGSKVFANKDNLTRLNLIVWPAIAKLAEKEIDQVREKGGQVVILDAAVLLEAGWDQMVHEIWTTIIEEKEAMKRIVERDGLPEEKALARIHSQLPNIDRVNRANVLFCTLWEYEYTQQQVENAWGSLLHRIPIGTDSV